MSFDVSSMATAHHKTLNSGTPRVAVTDAYTLFQGHDEDIAVPILPGAYGVDVEVPEHGDTLVDYGQEVVVEFGESIA